MKKILVIGSTVADIIINLPHVPVTAEDINIYSQSMSLGGCAHNVSDMIRHFGAPYELFSPIGTGIYGDFVRSELAKRGRKSPVPAPDAPNGCCYCFVEDSGERTFVVDHGAEYLFKKEWFDALDTSEFATAYICGLEIEDKTGGTIISFLEENPQLQVVFAPGPRLNHIDKTLMNRIFALKPIIHLNDDEICSFTSCESVASAAHCLYAMTGNNIVITCGSQGSMYYDGENLIHVPGVAAVEVVDTIGAGDSHAGAFLASITMGYSWEKALDFANQAAALVVANKGAILPDEKFDITIE